MAKLYDAHTWSTGGKAPGEIELVIQVNTCDILQETAFGCVMEGKEPWFIPIHHIGSRWFRTEQEAREKAIKDTQRMLNNCRLQAKSYIKATEVLNTPNLPEETRITIK